jgi:hypothetical protein
MTVVGSNGRLGNFRGVNAGILSREAKSLCRPADEIGVTASDSIHNIKGGYPNFELQRHAVLAHGGYFIEKDNDTRCAASRISICVKE